MLELIPVEDEIRHVYTKKGYRKSLYHIIKNMEIKEIDKELRLLERTYKLRDRYA